MRLLEVVYGVGWLFAFPVLLLVADAAVLVADRWAERRRR